MMAWMRGLPIFKALGVVLAAIAFALSAGAVTRRNAKADALERRAEKNAAAATGLALERAEAQTAKAKIHRDKATDIAKGTTARLDKIGAKDESLSELVTDWNGERLRKH